MVLLVLFITILYIAGNMISSHSLAAPVRATGTVRKRQAFSFPIGNALTFLRLLPRYLRNFLLLLASVNLCSTEMGSVMYSTKESGDELRSDPSI
jgi:hypothetical protein